MEEYSKFFNHHYELVAKIEERVTRYGTANCTDRDLGKGERAFQNSLAEQVDSINLMQLFSLAKKTNEMGSDTVDNKIKLQND